MAGSDEDRAADLQSAFDDPEVAVVICTRGGYGASRILPLLDLDRMAASGKLFAGFSDITSLHLALNKRGLPTLHAPMALTLHYPRQPWVIESFLAGLEGRISVPDEAPKGVALSGGSVKGKTVGGCLCLITDSIGTPYEIDVAGKILLIEDVDEAAHRVDAMLTHLRNAGVLQKVAGFVIGEMTRTDEKSDLDIGHRDWRAIFTERLQDLGKPAIIGYPFGHVKNMLTLGLGVEAVLDADQGELRFTETVCA